MESYEKGISMSHTCAFGKRIFWKNYTVIPKSLI
jgi:hypothetical protein